MYVVIGAGGFLGSQLIKSILENTQGEVLAAARNDNIYGAENSRVHKCIGDLTDEKYIDMLTCEINNIGNADILYTAACHNIDFVAEFPSVAQEMNIRIPEKFLDKVKSFGKLFFTSSDTVYGEGGTYLFKESDSLEPVSIYGRQKATGEEVFNRSGACALRLPLMFSESCTPAKKHFCDVVVEKILRGEEVQLSTGAIRSVLDYGSVADIILELFSLESVPQILNVSGDDALSKYDLGLMLAEKYNVSPDLIVPVENWGDFRDGAKRTDSTLLDNSLLKQILKKETIKFNL